MHDFLWRGVGHSVIPRLFQIAAKGGGGLHCKIGGAGAEAASQPHPFPRGVCSQQ